MQVVARLDGQAQIDQFVVDTLVGGLLAQGGGGVPVRYQGAVGAIADAGAKPLGDAGGRQLGALRCRDRRQQVVILSAAAPRHRGVEAAAVEVGQRARKFALEVEREVVRVQVVGRSLNHAVGRDRAQQGILDVERADAVSKQRQRGPQIGLRERIGVLQAAQEFVRGVVDRLGNLGRDVGLVHGKRPRAGAHLLAVAGIALPVVGQRLVDTGTGLLAHQAQFALGEGGQLVGDGLGHIGLRCAARGRHHAGAGVGGAGDAIDGGQRRQVGVGLAAIAPAWRGCAAGHQRRCANRGVAGRDHRRCGQSGAQLARAFAGEKRLPVVGEDVDGLVVEQLELPVVVATELDAVELVMLGRATAKGLDELGAVGLVGLDFKIIERQPVLQVFVLAKQRVLFAGSATEHTDLEAAGVFPATGGLVARVGRVVIRQTIELAGGRAAHGIEAFRIQCAGYR